MENENPRFFFYPRILVLWKTGTGEFSFCGKPESENFFFLSENSRFVENGNWRILVLSKTRIGEFFFFYPSILVLWKRRILVLWKTGTGDFSFCEKPESENFFFFIREFSFRVRRESENSRFLENQNRRIFFFFTFYPRILGLWKTGTEEFSFCGNPE